MKENVPTKVKEFKNREKIVRRLFDQKLDFYQLATIITKRFIYKDLDMRR